MPATGAVGTIPSAFAPVNALYDPTKIQQQTLNEQQIGQNETEMVARISAGLLDPKQYPDEASRAAAWPDAIATARRAGFDLRSAPEAYPGEAVLRRASLLGTSSAELYKQRQLEAANQALLGDGKTPAATTSMPSVTTTQPGTGVGAAPVVPAYGSGGPGASVTVPAEYMPYFQEASARTGIPVDLLIAQARQESGFNPGATGSAGEVGIMQIHPKTAASPGFGMSGVQNPDILRDPRTNINFGADYLAARAKAAGANFTTPEGQAAALRAYNGGGDPNYVANVFRYVPAGGSRTAATGATGGAQTTYLGDSLTEPGGVGGQGGLGVRGASPDAVLARLRDPNVTPDAQIRGKPVVLSSGASNDPEHAQLLAMQLQTLKDRGAGPVTVLGVGPGVKNAATVNAQLKQIAERNDARFVELPASQMSKDGIHPTAEGYATLRAQTAPAQGAPAAPGGEQQPGPYKLAGPPMAPPGGSTGGGAGTVPQPPANALAPGQPGAPPAQSQVQQQAQPAPPGGPATGYGPGGQYTVEQFRELRALQAAGTPTGQIVTRMNEMRQQNAALAHQARQEQRQATMDQETQQQHAIDNRYKELQYQLSQASNEREAGRYKMAQAEFDQKMVAANRRYPGDSQDAADMNLLLDGANGKADTSTPDYANAYARQKYKSDTNGNTIIREMSMFPTPAGRADVAPTVTKPPATVPEKAKDAMLANAAGQVKIMKALDALEAYPAAVGGLNTQIQNDYFLQRSDPQGVAARQAVANIQTHLFHELAGAAQSPSEAERLKPYAPKPTDTYSTIMTKLKGLMDINRETMLQAYRSYGPEARGERLAVIEEAIINSIPAAAIEHLRADTEQGREARFDKIFGRGAAKLVLSNG